MNKYLIVVSALLSVCIGCNASYGPVIGGPYSVLPAPVYAQSPLYSIPGRASIYGLGSVDRNAMALAYFGLSTPKAGLPIVPSGYGLSAPAPLYRNLVSYGLPAAPAATASAAAAASAVAQPIARSNARPVYSAPALY